MKASRLTLFIFIALVAGVLVGKFFPDFAVKTDVLSHAFLNMVKMIIAPLLFATLVVGIAGHGDVKNLGKLGVKTIIYFEIVTTIALVLGLVIGNMCQPGVGFSTQASASNLNMAHAMNAGATQIHSMGQFFVDIFPTSIVKAMSEGNLIQIVIFSIFFAIAICAVGSKGKPIVDALNSLSEIMFKFTELVMFFAPLGVFGAIASIVGHNGLGILQNYAKIIASLYFALILFVIIVFASICKMIKVPFFKFLKAIQEPILLAFSTASSEAALPKAMKIMEDFGAPKNIVGFVIPMGYTFDLTGSTLYLALGFVFSVQILGVELTIQQQIVVMLILMVTSKGIAGVPRVSLVVLAGTLTSMGYPILGVAILLGVDQVLDMGRTTINLIGNCLAAAVIAVWEKEFDYKKMYRYLGSFKNLPLAVKDNLAASLENQPSSAHSEDEFINQ